MASMWVVYGDRASFRTSADLRTKNRPASPGDSGKTETHRSPGTCFRRHRVGPGHSPTLRTPAPNRSALHYPPEVSRLFAQGRPRLFLRLGGHTGSGPPVRMRRWCNLDCGISASAEEEAGFGNSAAPVGPVVIHPCLRAEGAELHGVGRTLTTHALRGQRRTRRITQATQQPRRGLGLLQPRGWVKNEPAGDPPEEPSAVNDRRAPPAPLGGTTLQPNGTRQKRSETGT